MNVPVPMRDGVRLATDLYLPDADGPFPVVLVRTPYGSETPRFAEQGRFYATRGYVFAVQDTRGKYDSEGSGTDVGASGTTPTTRSRGSGRRSGPAATSGWSARRTAAWFR